MKNRMVGLLALTLGLCISSMSPNKADAEVVHDTVYISEGHIISLSSGLQGQWSTENASVADVYGGKTLVAKKEGTTKLTMVRGTGKLVRTVVVEKPQLQQEQLVLVTGETQKAVLSGTKQTGIWTSSNTDVVSVSATGEVTALKVGSSIITVNIDGEEQFCQAAVLDKAEFEQGNCYRVTKVDTDGSLELCEGQMYRASDKKDLVTDLLSAAVLEQIKNITGNEAFPGFFMEGTWLQLSGALKQESFPARITKYESIQVVAGPIPVPAVYEIHPYDYQGKEFAVDGVTYCITDFTKREVYAVKLPDKKKVAIPAKVTCGVTALPPTPFKVLGVHREAATGSKKINTVVLGKNISTVDNKAFYKCSKLKKVTIKNKKCTYLGKNIFKKTSRKLKIYVPKSAYRKQVKLLKVQGIKKNKVKS